VNRADRAIINLMRLTMLVVITVFLTLASTARAEDFTGKVIGAVDGDTIIMTKGLLLNRNACGGGPPVVEIHVQGVACPVLSQPFGRKAKQFTSAMVVGKIVTVKVATTDRSGRTLAWIDVGGKNLNEELLRAGLAWHYKKYDKSEKLAKLEQEAKKAKRGLWASADPVAPWEWRKGTRGIRRGTLVGDAHGHAAVDVSNPVCGNVRSNVAHWFTCKDAEKNCTATFKTAEAARATGYRLHTMCLRDARPTSASAGPFHGNTKSKVFHRSGCEGYDCKHCTASFKTRDDASKAGYKPCGSCKP
jgi:micrococcal nuclease